MITRRGFMATVTQTVAMASFAYSSTPRAQGTSAGSAAHEKNTAEQLAAYAFNLRYEDIDPKTIEVLKGLLIDTLGCAIAAQHDKPVQIARAVALQNAPLDLKNGATIIGYSRKTSIELATFANASAVRQLDLNDIYIGKEIGHPSDNAPACLATAEAEGSNGRDLLLALAVVYEVNCRLLDAAQINLRGWDHPSYGPPAVALAVGKLMKLSQEQMVEAINLAITGHLALNQTRVEKISNWKGLAAANAARNAIFATNLARAGMTGPSPIFEGKDGFFKRVSGPFKLDTKTFGGKGNRFRALDCSVKFYPAQGLTQTAIVAAIALAKEVGDLKQIQSLNVYTSEDGYDKSGKDPQKWTPETSETADHSLPYIVAKAMFDGDIGAHSYELDAIRDPALRTFMQKIKVIPDAELTAIYPKYYATRIVAVLQNGRELSQRIDDIPGFATRPMTRTDYENKFTKYAKLSMKQAQMARVFEIVWALDQQASVTDLLAALSLEGNS